jgi:hypothetical protein
MKIILITIIVLCVYIFLIQYCWNESVAKITDTKNVTFYQTFLLVVLVGTLLHTPLILSL